jgi:hypothetical protein
MVSPLRSGRTWAQMLSRTRAPQSLSLLVAMPAEDCPRPLARFLFWCRWRRCRPIRFMPEIAPIAYDHFAHNRFGKNDDQFTPRRNATEESQVASPLRAGGVTTAV